jgi:geranylgeranyl reductase family protein
MTPDFDVIVAGAGVGGAATACFLMQRGLRVLVVEQARLPRYKACGGAVPRSVFERFPFGLEDVVRATPDSVRFSYPGDSPVDASLPDRPVVMVMRSELDARLLAGSGAEVLEGTAVCDVEEGKNWVRVHTTLTRTSPPGWARGAASSTPPSTAAKGEGARVLTARYLIGADGAVSQVAHRVRLRTGRRFGGCLEAEVPLGGGSALEAEYGRRALFALGVIPCGYAWVFPKGDCLSVGIGRLRPGKADLRPALRETMARLGIPLDGVELHGHPIPTYQAPPLPWGPGWRQERLATARCLLVGDAAGLVDPLIGEGVRYAIASARLAAEAIASDDLSGYEAAVWSEIGHSLATCGLLADLFYRWPHGCFQLGARNPAIVRLFLDLFAERSSYIGVGRRMVAATLPWLLHHRG